jgi:lipoprotein-anchoring transpeptidase ErfK/SrfK
MHTTRRSFLVAAAGAASLVALPAWSQDTGAPAPGQWEAQVSIADQKMRLFHEGALHAEWPVSTARKGRVTPKGTYKPYWLSKHHRSSIYNNAPMPFAVFYDGNYAIHGTDQIEKLGTRASAGCVRLHPDNASFVFAIAESHGLDALRIVIS